VRLLYFLLGLVCATALHAAGSHFFAAFPAVCDPFLVLAVLATLRGSLAGATVGGSVAGLARDALSGGVYGLHGFADTLVAHVAARLQQRLVIQRPLQLAALLAVATALQVAVLALLQRLVLPGGELPDAGLAVVRMATSALLGILAFVLAGRARSSAERWREQRRRRLTMGAE